MDDEELTETLLQKESKDDGKHYAKSLSSFKVEGYSWVYIALLAGVFFAFTAFSMGKSSFFGVKITFLFSSGSLLFCIGYWIRDAIKSKREKGYFYAWKDSLYRDKNTGKFSWIVLLAILSDCCANFIA